MAQFKRGNTVTAQQNMDNVGIKKGDKLIIQNVYGGKNEPNPAYDVTVVRDPALKKRRVDHKEITNGTPAF